MSIPCVILHRGLQEYVKTNIEITSKSNPVILIGSPEFRALKNVDFYEFDDYYDHSLFDSFVNYSSNSKEFEWLCFSRMFMLKKFMLKNNINKVFHLDSDCILLEPLEKFTFEKENGLMISSNFDNPFRMSSSVHCSLIDIDFLDKFEFLFSQIYLEKENNIYRDMIVNKVNHHRKTNTPGGICDMTLYYILANEKLIDTQNLRHVKNDYAFMNTLGGPEGKDSKQQYRVKNNIIDINPLTNEIYDTINKKSYKLMNVHFQGGYKQYLNHNWIKNNLKVLK